MNESKYKAIIFGSNGYIGRHFSLYLSNKGWDILNCDIQSDSSFGNYKKIDITNNDELSKLNYEVDYIFFFSGITGTLAGFNNYEEFVSINEIGLLNLLNRLKLQSVRPVVIFPSTRLVYKGKDGPLKENDEKEPKTIYAVNKLACEHFLKMYYNMFGIPYYVFRICVPYGNLFSSDYSYGTIGHFINMAKQGAPITLFGGGEVKRTFSYIGDICSQIEKTILHFESVNDIYNVGGETFSLGDIATRISEMYNPVAVKSIPWPDIDLKMESGHTYFDDSKIINIIGDFEYMKFSDFNWLADV